MRKSKFKVAAVLALSASLMLATSASAFTDVKGEDAKITKALQDKGIIQGINKDLFAPNQKLTGAQGVQLIVKALDLKAKPNDNEVLEKADQAWYASSLKIAKDNGIELPKDFNPAAELSREVFVHILRQAVYTTGNYPLIKMYIAIADESEITLDYSGDVQILLLHKIATLDKDGKFNPKQPITRIEAAKMVYLAEAFVESYKESSNQLEQQVSYSTEKVNDLINKVTVTRANQPHPGYGIAIDKIEFTSPDQATVYYKLLDPDPDKMYIQVITDTHVDTYISSEYKSIKLVQTQ
ncbi:hypothetical protein D3C77_293010 [compost metagenome]